MTARGAKYLQEWISKTIKAETTSADAGWLAAHLLAEAAAAGFTLADLELDQRPRHIFVKPSRISPGREHRGIEGPSLAITKRLH
jgi:hypothetical protein